MLIIKSNKPPLFGREHPRVMMSDVVIKLGISCVTPSRPNSFRAPARSSQRVKCAAVVMRFDKGVHCWQTFRHQVPSSE